MLDYILKLKNFNKLSNKESKLYIAASTTKINDMTPQSVNRILGQYEFVYQYGTYRQDLVRIT